MWRYSSRFLRLASITGDAKYVDQDTPFELRIRDTAALSGKLKGKGSRKKRPVVAAKQKSRKAPAYPESMRIR